MSIRHRLTRAAWAAVAWAWVAVCSAQVVFPLPSNSDRSRYEFEFTLLQQALSSSHGTNTVVTDSNNTLVWSTQGMNMARATLELDAGRISIVPRVASPDLAANFTEVKFAIDKGLNGKRVLLTRKELVPKLAGVKTAADLKAFQFGVLTGWSDEQLLRDGGFSVQSTSSFDGLFQMLAKGRTDVILMGVLHHAQLQPMMKKYSTLVTEPSLWINVPTEQRFYTARSTEGEALAQRVLNGLLTMQRSGAFDKLHQRFHGTPEKLLLGRRKIVLFATDPP
jgi:ABC-type amino acid transport substrate-binding protein